MTAVGRDIHDSSEMGEVVSDFVILTRVPQCNYGDLQSVRELEDFVEDSLAVRLVRGSGVD